MRQVRLDLAPGMVLRYRTVEMLTALGVKTADG